MKESDDFAPWLAALAAGEGDDDDIRLEPDDAEPIPG
jgi:hypothetical protein